MMEEISANGLHQFLRSRRSVRHFLQRPVPEEVIERIVETASYAPSAHNRQPWRFVWILSMKRRTDFVSRLSEKFRQDLLRDGHSEEEVEAILHKSQERILQAPVAILVCLDKAFGEIYADDARQQAEYLMGVQGVAMAGFQLLLAAHAEGLGGVWMCAPLFAQDEARDALGLPSTWHPQGLILLGYPEGVPPTPARRSLEEVWFRA